MRLLGSQEWLNRDCRIYSSDVELFISRGVKLFSAKASCGEMNGSPVRFRRRES